MPRNTAINIPDSGVIAPADLPNGNLETTYAVDPRLKTGNNDSFNFTVERQVGRSIAVNVSYVGSVSHSLSYQVGDINFNPNDTSTNKGENRAATFASSCSSIPRTEASAAPGRRAALRWAKSSC